MAIQADFDSLKNKYDKLNEDFEVNKDLINHYENSNEDLKINITEYKNTIETLKDINKRFEEKIAALEQDNKLNTEALENAENMIVNLNSVVNFEAETGATKRTNIMKSMGDKEATGLNVGV